MSIRSAEEANFCPRFVTELKDLPIDQKNANRQKRRNFMGMDNMDTMFASLNSKPRFMSVDNSFGNLQNLLRKAGRKRR
ncbi:hypothetical protein MAR_008861 [Mya arenaria]|uniref:Uncharacterized protein n=1 Tax=Mya arenaria TaxID=6604 RepID=A0ABY7E0D3_MYAAR|nr:hypothetical protein MAR_008861 [Mya arenaria]